MRTSFQEYAWIPLLFGVIQTGTLYVLHEHLQVSWLYQCCIKITNSFKKVTFKAFKINWALLETPFGDHSGLEIPLVGANGKFSLEEFLYWVVGICSAIQTFFDANICMLIHEFIKRNPLNIEHQLKLKLA